MTKLNDSQLNRVSDLLGNFGLLLSTVIPVLTGVDKVKPFVVFSGLGASLISWFLSLLVLKGVKS